MGSNFILHSLKRIPTLRIINVDALTYAASPNNLIGIDKKRYSFVRSNIGNSVLMRRLMKRVDFVVNFAAETHVDRSIHNGADPFVESNIVGVHSLLKALRISPRIKKMIHISTDEVWGDLAITSKKKFNENSPFLPNSPYAASKAAGDLLIRSYVKTFHLPIITTHSVNNFGPRQFPEKLIPFFAFRAINNQPLPLYGDGKNVRDWLYVDDHSNAILTLLTKGVPGEVYAISADHERSNREIAEIILSAAHKPKSLITFVEDRLGHDRKYSVNSTKLRSLGWRPESSFDNAVQSTIQWYVKNHDKKLLSGAINRHIKIKQ